MKHTLKARYVGFCLPGRVGAPGERGGEVEEQPALIGEGELEGDAGVQPLHHLQAVPAPAPRQLQADQHQHAAQQHGRCLPNCNANYWTLSCDGESGEATAGADTFSSNGQLTYFVIKTIKKGHF